MPATQSDIHPDSAKILADLPLRPRTGLYVVRWPDAAGNLTILEEDADDCGSAGILGLAVPEEGGWYLGCIECCAEVAQTDSGMCRRCREDAAWQEQVRADEYQEEG